MVQVEISILEQMTSRGACSALIQMELSANGIQIYSTRESAYATTFSSPGLYWIEVSNWAIKSKCLDLVSTCLIAVPVQRRVACDTSK